MSKTDYKNLNNTDYKLLLDSLKSSGVLDDYLHPDDEQNIFGSLKYDNNGRIVQSLTNCLVVLQNDELLRDAIRFNDLTCRIDVTKDLGWPRAGTAFCDTDLDNIILYMDSAYGLHVDKQIERAIRIVANENHYHPVRDKLLSLSWDGTPRLSEALHHFLGVEKSPLSTEALKLFMLGAISRVFLPGCKFEYMLCLVGGQGAGKSTFFRFLAMNDDWFTDDIKSLDDTKVFQYIQGHWIIEMPEMLAILNAKMVEETKAFISRQRDNYRTPYDKYSSDHMRQCVFAGSSNITQFLPGDKSGNRRFIPLEVNPDFAEVHILDDEAASRAYIEQLWAEVMTIFVSGNFSLSLSKEMSELLIQRQEYFSPEDPLEDSIRNFLEKEKPDYVCAKMLYEKALCHSCSENMAMWESKKIGEIMDLRFPQYERLSSHKFNDYGTQRAWGLKDRDSFKQVTPERENDIPFLQESFL